MNAADFLDARDESVARPRASDFLDQAGGESTRPANLKRDDQGSVWRDDAASPSPDELARAERPASMTRSRRGRPTFVDIPAAPAQETPQPAPASATNAPSPQRATDVRAQPKPQNTTRNRAAAFLDAPQEPGALDTVKGMLRQFWADVRGPRSVMEDYQPTGPAVLPEDRASPVAPMRDDAYQALSSSLNHTQADVRERLAARTDVIGTATRKILEQKEERTKRLGTAFERLDLASRVAEAKRSDYQGFDQAGLGRVWNDYSSGVVGSTGAALAYTGRKLGVGPLAELGQAMTDYAERILPAQQTFGDKLVHAVGSMASFYVPGLGVQKGTTALASLSPALAKWTGAGTMAGLEAAAEADGIYQANVRAGKSPEDAASRADKAFLANLALLGVTDRLAFFNDIRGIGQRVAAAAAIEGPGQEAPQQVIQNYFTDQPLGQGVGEAAAIGAIVGGGARGVQSALSAPPPDAITRHDGPAARPDVLSPVQPAPEAVAVPATPSASAFLDAAIDAVSQTPPVAGAEIAVSQQPAQRDQLQEYGAEGMAGTDVPPLDALDASFASGEQSRFANQTQEPGRPHPTARGVDRAGSLSADLGAGESREMSATDFLDEQSPRVTNVDARQEPFTIVEKGVTNDAEGTGDQRSVAGFAIESAAIAGGESATTGRSGAAQEFAGGSGEEGRLQSASAQPLQPGAETQVDVGTSVDLAAHDAATSPLNDRAEPTEAQREAGNYRKGSVRIGGMDLSIENPAGSKRRPQWKGLGALTAMSVGDFKARLSDDPNGFAGPVSSSLAAEPASGEQSTDDDVLKRAYGASEPLARLTASSNPRNRRVGEALRSAAPRVAEMRDEIAAAGLQELDMTADIVGAVDEIMRLHGDRTTVKRALAGVDRTPESTQLLQYLENNIDDPKRVVELFDRYLGLVLKEGGRATEADSSERTRESANQASDDETLAATGVIMTPPYSAAGGQVNDASRARPDAIRQSIRTLFNVPINERHFKKSRDTLGIYKIKPRTIRVKNQNDIGVIAHETGHHFSETSRPVRVLMKTHEKELRAITPYAAQQKSAALQREEGFAEYLRLAWTQPQQAQQRAPGFHAAFAQYVDQNGHRKAFDAIEGAIRDWENLPPADRILSKVGVAVARPTRQELVDRFIFEVLDRWLPLKRMVADLKPGIVASKDPFKAAHLLAGDAAVIEDWITTHTIPFDLTRRADPKNYGTSLRDILKPVAKQLNEFKAYAIAVRANELRKADKEHLFTKEEIAAALKLETPAFKKAADELIAYNERLIDYAEEGGLLSLRIADRLRATGAYTVPFFRESDEGSRQGGGKNPFKRLFGGTENLRDPIANLVQNTANIIYATNRNAVLVKAQQLARDVPGGGRWIEDIPIPDKVLQVPTKSILEAFAQQGVTIDQQTAQALAHIQKLIVPNPVEDPAERIVIVRVNGEPKAVQINNKLLFKALQSFEPVDLGIVEKLLSVPSDLLRAGVTLSPEFMARNFMRDTLSGFMQSKPGLLPVVGTIAGFKEVATRSDAAKLFRAFGGAYADLWKGESTQTAKTLERMAKRGKFDPRSILTPAGVIRALKALGSVSEAGTRVAEFKKTAALGPGGIESLIEAAYNAREVSVDFGMHGANPAVRMLTRITPFLNPAMQGLYKGARTGRERFALTLFRGSLLTAFSVGLFMLNQGEDWYDELENWEKNVYWHFDVGLRDDDGQVISLRVPKPFEWGAVFGSVPEALAGLAIEQHGKDFAKRLGSIFHDVFALRAVPTALLVPLELWSNKNAFTGRDIVPDSKEALDPEFQHGSHASLTARELGALSSTSPAKIDHAIRGIFGTLGVYSVMLADIAARQVGDYPELPPKTWRQMPIVKAFVHDPDNPNSRYVTEFYELLKDARRRDATLRRIHEGTPAADAYEEKHQDVLAVEPEANTLAREFSKQRRDNEEIISSRDYTADEKRRLVNENNLMIKREAKDFMLDAARQGVKR